MTICKMVGNALSKYGAPALALDFTAMAALDPRITFTRAGSGSRNNSSGTMVFETTDVPRFDYDPLTLAPKGLLLERAATNLLVRSAEFDNASWIKSNITVSANSTVAPDGTTTADTITPTASDSSISQIASISSSTAYVFSVYLKASSTTALSFMMIDSAGASYANVTVTTTWTRFTCTRTSGSSATTMQCYIGGAGSFSTGETIVAWGAQLEAGSAPTSYIPTTSAAVTRPADVASMTGSNFSSWYSATGGTTYVEFDITEQNTYYPIIAFDDGTMSNINFYYTYSGNQYFQGKVGDVVKYILQGAAVPSSGIMKDAGVNNNNFAALSSGGAAATTSSPTMTLPTYTRLLLGSQADGERFSGHIRKVMYYPLRISNTNLTGLTS